MDIIIQKAKKHDKEAFVELMEDNEKNMYKVAKAILKNDEDVADAMQETVLTCWEKIGTLKKNEYFQTWLIRILINKCNATYKQRKRFVSDENYPEAMVSEDGFANAEWGVFLKFLDEKYRIVIALYYMEGFKVREIAQILDVSESAVKARLATARKQMERYYHPDKECEII